MNNDLPPSWKFEEVVTINCEFHLFGLIYPHAKFEKAAPVTIEMFDKVKLTTSTKVSSLHLVTTGGVLSF